MSEAPISQATSNIQTPVATSGQNVVQTVAQEVQTVATAAGDAAQAAQVIAGAIHGPYEDLAIEGLKVLELIIKSQPPDVQAKLWQMWIEDLQNMRDFAKSTSAEITAAFKKAIGQ